MYLSVCVSKYVCRNVAEMVMCQMLLVLIRSACDS
jgi:hypothetical protein